MIVNFVRTGMPAPENENEWPMYTSEDRLVMNYGKPGQVKQDFGHGTGPDLLDAAKCDFWQPAPYWPEPEQSRFVKQGGGQYYKEGLKA